MSKSSAYERALKSYVYHSLLGKPNRSLAGPEALDLHRGSGISLADAYRRVGVKYGVDFAVFDAKWEGAVGAPAPVVVCSDGVVSAVSGVDTLRAEVDWVASHLYRRGIKESDAPSVRAYNMWVSATFSQDSISKFLSEFVRPMLPKVAEDKEDREEVREERKRLRRDTRTSLELLDELESALVDVDGSVVQVVKQHVI